MIRRRREVDRSYYAFPPRRRPSTLAPLLARLVLLGLGLVGVLVAAGTGR